MGHPAATAAPAGRREIVAIVLVTVIALALRVIGANSGLWIDEVYALLRSFRQPLIETVTQFPHDNHHPLYSVLAHLSLSIFGEAPWSIRLPSILFGAATVPVLYGLGRRLVPRREAFLAAALLAVSYHHVWFSQNARGYVMIAFFAIACTWLMLRLLDGAGFRVAALYAICAALGAYTHLTMIFVVVGHACAVAVIALRLPPGRRAGIARTAAAAFVLAAVFTLLLYAPMLADVRDYFANRPSNLKGISTPSWALVEAFRVLAVGFGAGHLALGVVVIGVAVVLFCAGLLSHARANPVALALFLAPVGVIFAGAALARGTFYPRFLFALIGFGLLIGVRGVLVVGEISGQRLFGDRRRSRRMGLAVVGCAIVLSLGTVIWSYRLPKQDFTGTAAFLSANVAPGELVAAADVAVVPLRDYLHLDLVEVTTAAELAGLRKGTAVWLVYTFPRYLASAAPDIMAIADSSCHDATVLRGTVGGGDIVICRLEPVA